MHAYQKGKSCNTQIFTLMTITELGKKEKTPIFVTFVDLKKAFDRVRRTTMLRVLCNKGLGYNMVNAIKNLYSNTNVMLHKIGNFKSTVGIRQGAASSVYIFIIFINGLFKYLRDRFTVHHMLGKIHNLIHADDTVILDTNMNNMKLKIAATIEFFRSINQNINSGKTKYMIIDNNSNKLKSELLINNIKISYSTKEKYLGHYIRDDNSMRKSIELDIGERGANVIIKYRNFVNNHPCEISTLNDSITLQKDIHSLESWTKRWLLGFNLDKCHILTLGKFVNITHTHRYTVAGYEIEHVFEEKDLGVIFDSSATFEEHISAKIKKANSIAGLIRRSFTFLDSNSFIKIYSAFVRPHLEYAQCVWSRRGSRGGIWGFIPPSIFWK